jgi:response regulator RpfG family c-di-GMP phosphodiesterase
MEHGMTDFVSKPLMAEELKSKINAYVVHNNNTKEDRKLYFDIDEYAEGDAEFKQELVSLMISNIKELQQALHVSVKNRNPDIFRRLCHKVSPTIGILKDAEFAELIEQLKLKISKPKDVQLRFSEISDRIIHTLELELVA